MWTRLKRLWKISGINVDGFEFDTQRKQIINKLTDVLRPSPEEASANLDKYNKDWRKSHPAQFIPRTKEKPIDKVTKVGEDKI